MSKMPGDPCPVCRRSSGAVTLDIAGRGMTRLCSTDCAEVWMNRQPQNHNEKAALIAGGEAAGAYLDSIGKSDLAALTPSEWSAFCTALFEATCADLRRQASDWTPF